MTLKLAYRLIGLTGVVIALSLAAMGLEGAAVAAFFVGDALLIRGLHR